MGTFLWAGSALAALEGRELARVEALLQVLSTKTDITFVRNGGRYPVDKAVKHLRRKLDSAKGKISTCEQFIDHVASRSSISGKPYSAILADGTEVDKGVYLRELLAGVDAGG
jgi:hypothetical protein